MGEEKAAENNNSCVVDHNCLIGCSKCRLSGFIRRPQPVVPKALSHLPTPSPPARRAVTTTPRPRWTVVDAWPSPSVLFERFARATFSYRAGRPFTGAVTRIRLQQVFCRCAPVSVVVTSGGRGRRVLESPPSTLGRFRDSAKPRGRFRRRRIHSIGTQR